MTTIEIYNALIEAGIDKEKAKKASEVIVTRDLLDDSFDRLNEKIDSKFEVLQRQINILFGLQTVTLGLILAQFFIA